MQVPLNIAMMKNPYNWIILVLMVAVAGLALAMIFPSAAAPTGAQQ
jgi:hypothetical protein